jgi:hypothetical protein
MQGLIKKTHVLLLITVIAIGYSVYISSELADLNNGKLKFDLSENTPHGIGKIDGECLKSVVGEKGNLVSGPSVKLETGQYLAKFHITGTNEDPKIQAAGIDVFVNVNGQPKVLSGYSIDSNSSYKNRLVLFYVTDDIKDGVFEFRVFSTGDSTLCYSGVEVQKIN